MQDVAHAMIKKRFYSHTSLPNKNNSVLKGNRFWGLYFPLNLIQLVESTLRNTCLNQAEDANSYSLQISYSPSSSHNGAGNVSCFGYTHSFDLSQGLPESRRPFVLYSTVCFDIILSSSNQMVYIHLFMIIHFIMYWL